MPILSFSAANNALKPTILNWFQQPHVQDFYYGDGLKSTLNNLELFCQGKNDNGNYRFFHWVAYCDDQPFGFLMTSPIDGPFDASDPYNKHYAHNKRTYTLDLLIGNTNYVGQGLAVPMIQQFILDHYADADTFLIDPEISNKRAIHVYQKAGFTPLSTFTPDYNPKPHFMMTLDVRYLKGAFHAQ